MQHHLFHLHALSALHAGTGQAVGAVDLPIARERASGLGPTLARHGITLDQEALRDPDRRLLSTPATP